MKHMHHSNFHSPRFPFSNNVITLPFSLGENKVLKKLLKTLNQYIVALWHVYVQTDNVRDDDMWINKQYILH